MTQKRFGSLNTRTMIPTVWKTAGRVNALRDIFPSGKPEFYPFPNVTTVMNAAFCPLACIHALLHGLDNVTVLSRAYAGRWTGPVGKLFHEFIAHLKCSIMDGGRAPPSAREVYSMLQKFKMFDSETRRKCWEFYLKDWCANNLPQLQKLRRDSNVYFEIFVSNKAVKFEYDGGYRSYPLYGVIDELDLDGGRIIVRTNRGELSDSSPPYPEDYQAWLLWKALSNVKRSELPEPWRDKNFKRFKPVVETPFNNFEVKESEEFRRATHDAYAWILDICGEKPAAIREAYQNRFCDYQNRNEKCGMFPACYGKRYKHPRARGAMRARLGEFYRPLLWEQMWDHHLLRYKLQEMTERELVSDGILLSGPFVSVEGGTLMIKTSQANSVLFRKEEGETGTRVILGTTSVGLEMDGTVRKIGNDTIEVDIRRARLPQFKRATLVFPPNLSLIKATPWFLKKITQRDIFWLGKAGRDRDDKAAVDSIVQLLETLFDDRRTLLMRRR